MLVVSYVLLQTEVVKRRKHYRINEKILVVADRPEVAKAMALGFDNMVADMMWIRGIQYFGGNFSSLKDPEKRSGFINLFDAMTALDSRFVAAWKFGGFVFNESCSSPKKAVEFLLKGAEANPDNWELLFDAGFISFYTLEDHETAKKAFLAACDRGAPEYVRRLAFEMDFQSGKFLVAWHQYAEHATQSRERGDTISEEIALAKLDQIYLMEVTKHLENATTLYREKNNNQYPGAEMSELIETGALQQAIKDHLDEVLEAEGQASRDSQMGVFELLTEGTKDVRRLLYDRTGESPLRLWLQVPGADNVTVTTIESRATLAALQKQQLDLFNDPQMGYVSHYENVEPGLPLESLDDLFEQEWMQLDKPPEDPLGGEYVYDPVKRQVVVQNMRW